jgi:hypothetical protein
MVGAENPTVGNETAPAGRGCQFAAGGWHEGESAEQVYVERYEMRGAAFVRVFHGWIDSESRKLVQAG